MTRYYCTCCIPAKSYSRTDKLYKHRQKYDPNFIDAEALREYKRLQYEAAPRKCDECGATIPYTERNIKKYCSQSCSAKTSNRKRCSANYDGQTYKKYYASWRDRGKGIKCKGCDLELKNTQEKWCSNLCKVMHDRQNLIDTFINGSNMSLASGELQRPIRDYLLREANGQCSRCGWSELHPVTGRVPLQVDHIDGNFRNNVIGNLRVLCPNCHCLTPTYGILNKGKGRTYRIDRMNRGTNQ